MTVGIIVPKGRSSDSERAVTSFGMGTLHMLLFAERSVLVG